MRSQNILLISAFILLTAGISLANSNKTISIAIITDKASDLSKSPLVSLLEVELSQKEGIQLLERAEIDKILDEQKLSAAGLLDRNTAVKIGKLLRADAFLILSLESRIQDANDLIRVRFAETAHGVRLLDYFEESESSNPKEAIERIIRKIESMLNKITQPDEELIPVGIVDIHRVELGEKYKMLERTLPTMLSVRLSLEPQIIMLEREDLKVLLDEKLRTESEDSKFWNSAILIDGYIKPNNGQLEMYLNLKQPDGTVLKSLIVPVEPNKPTIAIEKAVAEINKNLNDSPPSGRWDTRLEAAQYYIQGKMLEAHNRHEEAISIFETAHSLQPQNVYFTGALFNKIWEIRYKIEYVLMDNEYERRIREEWIKNNPDRGIEPLILKEPEICPYSDTEIAELVSILVRQIKDGYENDMLSADEIRLNWIDPYGHLDYTLSSSSYFSSYASVSNEYVKMINRENRRIWIDIINEIYEQKLLNREITQHAMGMAKARLAWISSDDPNEWIENLKKAFTEYIMPPELGGKIKPTLQRREDIFYQAFQIFLENHSTYTENYSFMKGSNERYVKLWRNFLKKMTDVNEPIVKINCYVALALGGLHSDIEEYKDESHKYGCMAFELIRDTFTSPNISRNLNIKEQLVKRFKNLTYGRVFNAQESIQMYKEICDRLIENNDIDSLVLLNPGFRPFEFDLPPQLFQKGEIYKQYYLLLDKIAEVLQIRNNDKQVNTTIATIRDYQSNIRNQFPELISSLKTLKVPVKMLLTKKEWPQISKMKFNGYIGIPLIIKEKMLWAGFSSGATMGGTGGWPIDVGLAGIDIEKKETTAIWQSQIITSEPVLRVTGLSITPEAIYLSLTNAGIVEFPGSLKIGREYLETLKVITEESNFPSNLVTSIFHADPNFWVAYGGNEKESGLGLYNTGEDIWETVFCSTLKSNTLFGVGKPYIIHAIQIVPPNKMFFLVYEPGIPKIVSSGNPEGFWVMNTENHELKYLGPIWLDQPERINVEYINGKICFKSWYFIIEFDPNSQEITKIMGDTTRLDKWYSVKNIPLNLASELFVLESFLAIIEFGPYYIKGNLDLSTSAIHNNKLWARLGESQIIIVEKGNSFEEAQIIDNNLLDGEPVHKFVSTPYGLIAIGEGTVGLIEDKE